MKQRGNMVFHEDRITVYPHAASKASKSSRLLVSSKPYNDFVLAHPTSFSAQYAYEREVLPTGRYRHSLNLDTFGLPTEKPLITPVTPVSIFYLISRGLTQLKDHLQIPKTEDFHEITIFPSSLFFHPSAFNRLIKQSENAGYKVIPLTHEGEPADHPQPKDPTEFAKVLTKEYRKYLKRTLNGEAEYHPEAIDALKPVFTGNPNPKAIARKISNLNRRGFSPVLEQIFPKMFVGYRLTKGE
ncbi:MAG: hypothetical protein AABX01_05350 [Candidatus Micrarchaeota archaeon]